MLPNHETLLHCQILLHDRAEILDTKSWGRFQAILTLTVPSYTSLGGINDSAVPASDLVRFLSSPILLGNSDIQT
ncbi:hypothetical protein EYZ11_000294 [Aspergillus tanneri]|uniref:Uncharacterized protein n=1 Tax=Aspergillus tanneri TaxID=1220188 RepID=A0A4S3JXZ5_9EURO|nr:hypothetical protein EYZ11_000294 [Aspergillus tanneri]